MEWKRHVWSLCLIALSAIWTPAGAQVMINEFDSDQVGFDTQEFIELYDGGIGNTDLTGLIVVLFSGASNTSYLTIDLSIGGYFTNASGFFTIGSTGMGTPIEYPPGAQGWLENGPDAIAVYADSAASFPNGTPVTDVNLIDAVVYSNDSVQAPILIATLLLTGESQLDENGVGYGETVSMSRCPNGSGIPRTTSPFTFGLPSPQMSNDCSFETPTPVPTSTPTQTPTRTPTNIPTSTPTQVPPPPCDGEYAENGDMEAWTISGSSGPPDHWQLTIPPYVTFTAEQDTTTVFAGSSSVLLHKTPSGLPTDTAVFRQSILFQIVPSTIYTLSAQVYDNNPEGYLQMYIQWRDSENSFLSNSIFSGNTTDIDAWQLLTLSDVSPGGAYYARIQIRVWDVDDGIVDIYLDDVSLTEPCDPIATPTPIPTATPSSTPTQAACDINFLANPSFEFWSGLTIDDWYGDTGVMIQPDFVNVHDGTWAASVSRNLSGTDMTSIYMSASGSSLYDASIWVIDNDPNLDARFYVLFYNSNMNWVGSSPWIDTTGENPDYQELSFTSYYTPLSAQWARMRVRFINTDGSYPPANGINGTIVVDDGSIIQNCDASTPTPNPEPTPANYRTIYQIQFTAFPGGDSPYQNQIVRTSGTVTAMEIGHPDLFIQDTTGAWNGLHITIPTGPGAIQQGDSIVVQGMVAEMLGMTTIMDPDLVQILSHGNPLPETVELTCNEVNQEAYEGVMVRINDLDVTSVAAGPGEWEAADLSGTIRVDDMYSYTYSPSIADLLHWIQGPVSSESGTNKIQPRNDNDIYRVNPLPAMDIRGLLILLAAIGGIMALRRGR